MQRTKAPSPSRRRLPALRAGLALGRVLPTLLAASTAHAGAELVPLGDLPGGAFESVAHAVSAEGGVVVGASATEEGAVAFRWTEQDGMQPLGPLAPGVSHPSEAFDVSDDGAVIVGRATVDDPQPAGIWWTAADGVQTLGTVTVWFPGPSGEDVPVEVPLGPATAVSADGRLAAGTWFDTFFLEITGYVRDLAVGSLRVAGYSSPEVTAVSNDGIVTVSSNDTSELVQQSPELGFRFLNGLTTGTGCCFPFSRRPVGRSTSDGNVVVGRSETSELPERPARWDLEDGVSVLSDKAGVATAVSEDGQVIVGYLGLSGPSGPFDRAFLWTSEAGGRSLVDALRFEYGVPDPFDGWSHTVATDVSPDGSVIVGVGTNPSGQREAWLVRLGQKVCPPPGGGVPDPSVCPDGVTVRVARWNAQGGTLVVQAEHPSGTAASLSVEIDGGAPVPMTWSAAAGRHALEVPASGPPLQVVVRSAWGAVSPPRTVEALARTRDLDGDRRTDAILYDVATGVWTIRASSSDEVQPPFPFGAPGYVPVTGDFDGDGIADIGLYGSATDLWVVIRSSDAQPALWFLGGTGVEMPVAGDYDGDGKADPAVHDEAGAWIVQTSSAEPGAPPIVVPFGAPGWQPTPGDYDGDGVTDLSLYHATAAYWIHLSSLNRDAQGLQLGDGGDVPVACDYDGDGFTDRSVYDPATGAWTIRRSSGTFQSPPDLGVGGGGWTPAPGDYDGDGLCDPAVFDTTGGAGWRQLRSTEGLTSLPADGPGVPLPAGAIE